MDKSLVLGFLTILSLEDFAVNRGKKTGRKTHFLGPATQTLPEKRNKNFKNKNKNLPTHRRWEPWDCPCPRGHTHSQHHYHYVKKKVGSLTLYSRATTKSLEACRWWGQLLSCPTFIRF